MLTDECRAEFLSISILEAFSSNPGEVTRYPVGILISDYGHNNVLRRTPSSWMCRRVVLVGTDVSGERISIFRVETNELKSR
jgi:hypothetical protein